MIKVSTKDFGKTNTLLGDFPPVVGRGLIFGGAFAELLVDSSVQRRRGVGGMIDADTKYEFRSSYRFSEPQTQTFSGGFHRQTIEAGSNR